jgi:signal transduction histidine kinase
MSNDPDNTRGKSGGSLMRELAHELRDALSPLASAADLARLRRFDPEASRLLAEKVERGLRRALELLDMFVLAEQSEQGTLPLRVGTVRLADILESARASFAGDGRYTFEPPGGGVTVRADPGRSSQVLAAVLRHAAAITAPDQGVAVRTVTTGVQPEIRVRSRVDPVNMPGEEWFASYRGGDARMALRTAQRIMSLQGGTLDLLKEHEGAFELILRFAAGQALPEPKCQPSREPRRAES